MVEVHAITPSSLHAEINRMLSSLINIGGIYVAPGMIGSVERASIAQEEDRTLQPR